MLSQSPKTTELRRNTSLLFPSKYKFSSYRSLFITRLPAQESFFSENEKLHWKINKAITAGGFADCGVGIRRE